ncbi:MAG TPA: protease modulator HflC [Verrucomicrobiae bacterium]|nr:protease modulator HflC [Verrucomicrobiae bacterium]
MKNNRLTLVVGVILVVVFFLLLFTFQVRQTEVVMVTTFDRPTRPESEPGLKFKWPYPIQKVYRFDKRTQNFEDDFEETLTGDNYNLLAMVYVGWTVSDVELFFRSFPQATPRAAEPALKGLIRSAKNAVVGKHKFADFISTDAKQLKFVEIEKEILDHVKQEALQKYGIGIDFLGIKKLGLPESVTQKVFDRMTAERQREVDRLKAQGEAEAMRIRSAADRDRDKILAGAEREASAIRSEGDAEAAKSFEVFKDHPELAVFLLKLNALEASLKDRSTLILDERTPPFDLLNGVVVPAPKAQGNAPQSSSSNR